MTQRGNRRGQTFFGDSDYVLYRDLLATAADKAGSEVWCYCLMPNHVHIVVVPTDEEGLRRTFADAHRRYTGYINARQRWTGHLWQGRFGAVGMDETHLAHAVRYVSLNPVRARLVERHGRFVDFLDADPDGTSDAWRRLRMSETSGRPLGSEAWLDKLEAQTGRTLKPRKRGRKPKADHSG